MYIESVPNRSSPPAILLRESYRQAGKVRKRTLANLSKWPAEVVEGLRTLLKGGSVISDLSQAFQVQRTRPHGHVAAVLGTLRRLGLERLLATRNSLQRRLVVALIVARILEPRSKLATARGWDPQTLSSSLGELLQVEAATADDLYGTLDWLLARQPKIENQLAAQRLQDGCLVIYDVTSTYFEGRSCPLAQRGYSRDGKGGTLQIVFGLLCDRQGCPVAVEVFEGNRADPTTVTRQIQKLRQRFGLRSVVVVGDRGMLTEARIREELKPLPGMGWITALRGPQIRKLFQSGPLQLSLFDERDLAEIQSPDYPGERLIVCRNPLLAEERARNRQPTEGRIRRPGAGRKPLTVSDPGLVEQLEEMIEVQTRGDPESPLRWICKSTRAIAKELARHKHPVSHTKVAQILHDLDYSLQSNRKTEEGKDHPDRDAQFRHISATVSNA